MHFSSWKVPVNILGACKGKGRPKRWFVYRLIVTPLRRSGMACVLKGSHSFIRTPRVHPLTEWTIPAFAFPAEAGTHLPTPEGWKDELALGGWLVTYWNRCPAPGIEPDTVTHLSTNQGPTRRLTSLIKANVLTTTPDVPPERQAAERGWSEERRLQK